MGSVKPLTGFSGSAPDARPMAGVFGFAARTEKAPSTTGKISTSP
jgi:hypothetical protein